MEIKNIEMRQHELRWAIRRKQVKDEITLRKQQAWKIFQQSKDEHKKAYEVQCEAIDRNMQAVMADLEKEQVDRLMAIAKEEDDYKFEVAKYTQQIKEGGEQ